MLSNSRCDFSGDELLMAIFKLLRIQFCADSCIDFFSDIGRMNDLFSEKSYRMTEIVI